jgi:hypothetical protein
MIRALWRGLPLLHTNILPTPQSKLLSFSTFKEHPDMEPQPRFEDCDLVQVLILSSERVVALI